MSEETKDIYLGPKKVRSVKTSEKDDRDLMVKLKDNSKIIIRQKLFNLMKTDKPTKSADTNDVTSAMYYFVAKRIVLEMADYGLQNYQVDSVCQHVITLVHNLVEAKVGEKFNCSGIKQIELEDLL